MKSTFSCTKFLGLALFLASVSGGLYAQYHPAEVRIVNQSQRTMQIKVMRNTSEGAVKYTDVFIPANDEVGIAIYQTGNYYLKAKAEYTGRQPVYSMGDPFECYVGAGGYSVLTFTYTIDETSATAEGKTISRNEFERDRD